MPAPLAPINLQVTPFMPVPLIQAADLVYQGGFKVPTVQFDSGGSCLTYRAATDSLFLANSLGVKIGELSLASPVIGTAVQMNRATLIQPATDITQGQRQDPAFSYAPAIAGLLIDGTGRLIVSVVSTYDAAVAQTKSHLVSGVNFSALPATQPLSKVEATSGQPKYQLPGFTAGYMIPIPSVYQASLGAPYLTGQGCLSIISRTSWGPSLTTFDPALVGNTATITGFRLVAYEDTAGDTHKTLGTLQTGSTERFNGVARLFGAIWPSHTRSVLVFGRTGTHPVNYGTGTNDPAKVGFDASGSQTPPYTPCNGCNNQWIYDPTDFSHGYHGYPYKFYVWAYDADDLVAVKQGSKQPWEVVPYATWDVSLPNMQAGFANSVGSVTYKEATKQIFISARGGGDSSRPMIYVFQLP